MNRNELKDKISSLKTEILFEESEIETQFLTIEVTSKKIYELISDLKQDKDTSFDYLFCQTAIDYPDYMEVIYHLRSTTQNHELVVKAKIEDRQNPEIDSMYSLYKTADFHEREIFDLFGIKFNNHPDLRRIFLDDDWEGFPLRKDYVDEINIVEL